MPIPGGALEKGLGAPTAVESGITVARDIARRDSWSLLVMASVDGGVEWEDWSGGFYSGEFSEIKWLARVESVRVKTITPNLFGQVASGSLVITGPLGVLKVTENKSPKPNMPGDILEACDHGADIFWDSKEFHMRFGSERTSAIWSYKTYHAAPTHNASSYGDDVFFMPLRIMDYDYFNYDYEAPMLQGLLLLPCADAQGTYRRVGQLTISAHAHREAFECGKWPLQSKTRIVNRRLYQSAREDGEYTILVV